MQHCLVINWGHKWKTRVSAAGTPSPFLPLCTLEISSFTQEETSAPLTQANIEVDNTHKDLHDLNNIQIWQSVIHLSLWHQQIFTAFQS